ncbi:hypothetical protein KAFR_0A06600 [Kazachstania africana CBS 2517]|uniref:CMP/dCMP-type deaminase domain-containing protein n=1 Tax=Kazachstania africana (strain ATCC 22294 / BCRC 22015 / CBS 2517 / CECT 1963 / NBRC 1671 / NRRL Y-8276) TaxID=1071382 RepID=H2ANZ5_KAZAF|nr:hypothetical protein KAFR_0A06600 [Kazachstania africana CBS 2517]CCF56095.1 hypothetical protein KAFR_0A06600 [Kazachstania africana CBS 2517]
MVKKRANPLRIDFKKGIIEDKLLQIRNEETKEVPDLIHIWTVDISPKDSKKFIELVRFLASPRDPVSLLHIKRVKKNVIGSNTSLMVALCSIQLFNSKDEVIRTLQEFNRDLVYENLTCEHQAPLQGPGTKEQAISWSEKYWPLIWRGNPNDQILNDMEFDMLFIKDILKKISEKSKEELANGNKRPIVTAFVEPSKKETIITTDSCCTTPLDHSIMNGIRKVAENNMKYSRMHPNTEKTKDSPYLCLGYEIYTTHEPCSMCSMALIHSRIKRCIFIEPMAHTGSLTVNSGDGYCMHNNRLLNSKYEVFQWIGDEYKVPALPRDTCC